MSTDVPAGPISKKPGLFRRTLRRHWMGLLTFWFIGSLAACSLVYSLVPPIYKAYSVLRAEPAQSQIFGLTTSGETFDMFLQTQMQLLVSPNVLIGAGTNAKAANLKRIQASGDVVQELKKVVKVSVAPGTTLIEVSMTSSDSYEAAVIVNAVVDAFLATNEEWADGMTRKQIKGLEEYLKDLHNQTDELERRWKEIVANGDVDNRQVDSERKRKRSSDDSNSNITIEQFKRLEDELFRLHLDLVQAEGWVKELKEGTNAAVVMEPALLEKFIEQKFRVDPDVVPLASKLMAANEKLEAARRLTKTNDDPAVRAAERKLETLKSEYNQLWETKSKDFRTQIELTSALETHEHQFREAEFKVRELKAKEAALKAESKKFDVEHRRQATDDVEIKLLQDQRASIKAMQEAVQRRLEQLRYESRGETRVRKVSDAVASTKPISDRRPMLAAIAPIAMLLTAFCFFLVVEAVAGPKPRETVAEPR